MVFPAQQKFMPKIITYHIKTQSTHFIKLIEGKGCKWVVNGLSEVSVVFFRCTELRVVIVFGDFALW